MNFTLLEYLGGLLAVGVAAFFLEKWWHKKRH